MTADELLRAGSGPHTLRHTMATMFMKAGGQARKAQKVLDHKNLETTTGIYDSGDSRELADTMANQWDLSSGTDVSRT